MNNPGEAPKTTPDESQKTNPEESSNTSENTDPWTAFTSLGKYGENGTDPAPETAPAQGATSIWDEVDQVPAEQPTQVKQEDTSEEDSFDFYTNKKENPTAEGGADFTSLGMDDSDPDNGIKDEESEKPKTENESPFDNFIRNGNPEDVPKKPESAGEDPHEINGVRGEKGNKNTLIHKAWEQFKEIPSQRKVLYGITLGVGIGITALLNIFNGGGDKGKTAPQVKNEQLSDNAEEEGAPADPGIAEDASGDIGEVQLHESFGEEEIKALYERTKDMSAAEKHVELVASLPSLEGAPTEVVNRFQTGNETADELLFFANSGHSFDAGRALGAWNDVSKGEATDNRISVAKNIAEYVYGKELSELDEKECLSMFKYVANTNDELAGYILNCMYGDGDMASLVKENPTQAMQMIAKGFDGASPEELKKYVDEHPEDVEAARYYNEGYDGTSVTRSSIAQFADIIRNSLKSNPAEAESFIEQILGKNIYINRGNGGHLEEMTVDTDDTAMWIVDSWIPQEDGTLRHTIMGFKEYCNNIIQIVIVNGEPVEIVTPDPTPPGNPGKDAQNYIRINQEKANKEIKEQTGVETVVHQEKAGKQTDQPVIDKDGNATNVPGSNTEKKAVEEGKKNDQEHQKAVPASETVEKEGEGNEKTNGEQAVKPDSEDQKKANEQTPTAGELPTDPNSQEAKDAFVDLGIQKGDRT